MLSEPDVSQAQGISTRYKKESGLQNSRNMRHARRGVCAHVHTCTRVYVCSCTRKKRPEG